LSRPSDYLRRIGSIMVKTFEQSDHEHVRFNEIFKQLTIDNRLIHVHEMLSYATRTYGNAPALIYQDNFYSYQDLYNRVRAFSRVIKDRGMRQNDRVLICFENSLEFYVAYYAVWQVGAVVAPLNTFLKETELGHIIQDAQPALLITETDRVALFQATGIRLPPILTQEDMPKDYRDNGDIDVISTANPDEMVALLYTSGTTGVPKGVMLSSKNIITNIIQSMARLGIHHDGERVFGVLPFFHAFAQMACIWGSILMGAAVIIVPKIERRYLLDGLKHKPTLFLGVPALFGLLCLMKNAPVDSVKYFVSGGDSLPDKIRSFFGLIYRRNICNGYGLTETSPTLAADLDDEVGPSSTVGRPLIGIDCSIRDEGGNELPRETIGTLWVKGDNVMKGYYNAPEATNLVLKDGWFNTGDLAYIDRQGKIVITGRMKDVIKHKGINIYPPEVENVILSHPAVIQVGVVGKHENAVGEIPIAFVQLRTSVPGIEQQLKELCMKHLATYKVPKQFICSTNPLPMTSTGKIDKKQLRKLLE
jgi:long-chain acyl-CoA synthetase